MKRQIRFGVFETNSSSTHSLSIYERGKFTFNDIPRNSEVIIDDNFETVTEQIFDQMGKLNFVVTMLASICECHYDDDKMERLVFDDFINLNWFKWLKEVVKEESNTEVIYQKPTYYWSGKDKTFPYYETTYDEESTVESIFTKDNPSILEDEVKFKERVKHIIYNPEVIIEDKENEY